MFSTKNSRDVGMVPPSSSCLEKPTGEKGIGTKWGLPLHSNNPGQQSSVDTYFTSPTSGNI